MSSTKGPTLGQLKDHDLVPDQRYTEILVEKKPVFDTGKNEVDGLHSIWITLNNPEQLNSYTTQMVKEVIRRAPSQQ